jgi:hypothetical protein
MDGLANADNVAELDHEDSEGNSYAIPDEVHTLSDGTRCHTGDAETLQKEIDDAIALEEEESMQNTLAGIELKSEAVVTPTPELVV